MLPDRHPFGPLGGPVGLAHKLGIGQHREPSMPWHLKDIDPVVYRSLHGWTGSHAPIKNYRRLQGKCGKGLCLSGPVAFHLLV